MTLTFKFFLVIIFAAILHGHVFSQEKDAAHEQYELADRLINKNPDKAFELLKQAMYKSKQKNDLDVYLKSVNTLGSFTLTNDKYRDQVFIWLKDAFKMSRSFQTDDQLAQLHLNIADFYNRITIEIDTPIYHYEQAKKIWTTLKGERSIEVSNCYHGLGNIYKYYKFDFYEAEQCYEKALLIREQLGFNDADVLYKNYYSLAATNRSQFDFEKALSYGIKTLEVAKKLRPDRNELAHGMVANIYRDMGESDLAKQHYLRALALNEKTKDLESRAWYYSCLGETFKKDSLYSKALQYFTRAYDIYQRPEIHDDDLYMNLLIAMMDAYSKHGIQYDFFRIRKEIFKSLSSLSKQKSMVASEAWRYVGDHHLGQLHYDSALICYQMGLIAAISDFNDIDPLKNPSEAQIGLKIYATELLVQKASALRKKFYDTSRPDFLEHALYCLRLVEKSLSLQRSSLDLDNAKWKFLDANFDLYENIISILDEGKNQFSDSLHHLAFQYFERGKARSLADALTEAEFTSEITDKDSLFRVLNELRRELFRLQDLIDQQSQNKNDKINTSALRDSVVQIDRRISACKVAIEERHPGYFTVKYGYQYVTLDDVQKLIKAKQQVLVEYFWGTKSVYAIAIDDHEVAFKRLGATDSVGLMVERLISHLTTEQSSMSAAAFRQFAVSAHQLYMTLINPFATILSEKKKLQIIPDGVINQIPFEILIQEKPELGQVNYKGLNYMIKSHAIGYAYSSSMLLQKNRRQRKSRPSILAVGFTGARKLRDSGDELNAIEGTNDELNVLRKRFVNGKFLAGDIATELNFKVMAPDFDIIHLAIHGRGDTQNDFAASLYFSSVSDEKEDGELHAYELYGLKLKAMMAVLSACESGLGKGYRGEGMISMASAFSYSGCENILMSLWKVNDQSSIALMDQFYNFLGDGEEIDDALRMAKLNYLEAADELSGDPKTWAPLVAYGNLEEVFPSEEKNVLHFAWLLIIALALFLSFKIFRR